MFRALTIIAAIAALAVSAAPASAGLLSSPLGTAAKSSRVLDVSSSEVFELNTAKAKAPPTPRFLTHTRFRDAATKQINEQQY